MLIEDNTDMLENLTEYLEIEGYKILGSNTGKQGIELAMEFIPDLIICDVLMREMDGHEVLRLLLGSEITSKIPFIFSTSLSEKIDKEESLKLGADYYIVKPFELETLLTMIQTAMKMGNIRHRYIQ